MIGLDLLLSVTGRLRSREAPTRGGTAARVRARFEPLNLETVLRMGRLPHLVQVPAMSRRASAFPGPRTGEGTPSIRVGRRDSAVTVLFDLLDFLDC